MAKFVHTRQGLENILCSSMITCSLCVIVGNLSWMASLLSPLRGEEAIWLERSFEETRVSKVVKALNYDKAPGTDGFSMGFFQSCWQVLKANIMNVFCTHKRL